MKKQFFYSVFCAFLCIPISVSGQVPQHTPIKYTPVSGIKKDIMDAFLVGKIGLNKIEIKCDTYSPKDSIGALTFKKDSSALVTLFNYGGKSYIFVKNLGNSSDTAVEKTFSNAFTSPSSRSSSLGEVKKISESDKVFLLNPYRLFSLF